MVKLSKNYVATKFGIKKSGEKSVVCKGRRDFYNWVITFYAKSPLDKIPDEVKINPTYWYCNNTDAMVDYYVNDSIRILQQTSPEVFAGINAMINGL